MFDEKEMQEVECQHHNDTGNKREDLNASRKGVRVSKNYLLLILIHATFQNSRRDPEQYGIDSKSRTYGSIEQPNVPNVPECL